SRLRILEPVRGRVPVTQSANITRHHFCLLMSPLPAKAGSLHHTEDKDIVTRGMHRIQVEMRGIASPVEQRLVNERIVQLVPGRGEYDVILRRTTIAEMNVSSVESLDVRAYIQITMTRMKQDE